jgi:DNA-binding response OmpR family regulator
MHPPLILLIEADNNSRLCAANEMLDAGYEVVEGDNALEAMSILSGRDDFNALVADVDLDRAPGGLALVRWIAGTKRHVSIIVTSEWTEAQTELTELGARFLTRPYSDGALVRKLRTMLRPPPSTPKRTNDSRALSASGYKPFC